MRTGIVAAGNWIVDFVKTVDKYPEQDTLANILAEETGSGGSPYNILLNLSRLGADFPLVGIGLTGADDAGAYIRADCERHGIDTSMLGVADVPTSYTLVMSVEGTGRRTFFHQRGANALLQAENCHIQGRSEKHFHLGYLLLLDGLDGENAALVLAHAQANGFTTSIDVVSEDGDRFESLVVPVLPYVDICFMNEFEASRTTGVMIVGDPRWSIPSLAARLIDMGVRQWAVVHFEGGACAASSSGEQVFQPAVAVPRGVIRSAVGAGDAFAAGVLYGLHGDVGMAEALRYGVAAAAACLREATCGGVASLEECLALAEGYGFR